MRTYYVPVNQTGNLWTVFRITGSGEFQDINTISGLNNVWSGHVLDAYADSGATVIAANRNLR